MSRRSRRQPQQRRSYNRPTVSPETRHGVAVVTLFVLGIVGALAFVGIAGRAGAAIVDGLRALFGQAALLVPIVLLVLTAMLVREERPPSTAAQAMGILLLALSITGLLHLKLGADATLTLPTITNGGGYLGLALALPFRALFGPIVAVIFLIGGTIIGIFLGFHLSIAHARAWWRAWVSAVQRIRLAVLTARYRERKMTPPETPVTEPDTTFTERTIEAKKATDETAANGTPTPPSTADALAAPARQRRHRPRIELPLTLLNGEQSKPASGDIRVCQEIIRKTLEHFHIPVEMGDVSVGPTVTQFTLRPADGVKLSKITALHNDLSLALAAHPIRIEAPIPGKPLVGIEVPNQKVAVVRLREMLESEPFHKRQSNLTIALGKDVAGAVWTADLAHMPHLLVAGSTGSGKSVMLHSIIAALLYQNGPDDLRLLLVDPKRVEFPVYNGIPHLLTSVVTDVKRTVQALKWALVEMDRRFERLAAAQRRDLRAYNATRREEDRLPYLVIIIDELADLMAIAAADVEAAIIRLAQMSRAVGIHLIVATQRPSVDVLTGLIKANITSRIAFAVASSIDSRTILDQVGAERLLGRGDMLFTTAEISKPRRLQGAFVGEQEIQRVVEYIREHGVETDDEINLDERPIVAFMDETTDQNDDDDPLLSDAKEVLIQAGKGSASLLQRRLKIGYARAARILDILERQGFIGPADGAKPREVYGASATSDSSTDDAATIDREPPDDMMEERAGDT
ncbi:MAG: DNA translocase FtsK 4TM domain-containing protein [Candidatus Uhrbacteria bacterium]